MWLKQSTAVVISYGPFLDKTDGNTLETGLVSAIDHATTGIKCSKNGGALTIRSQAVTASTYDGYGNYLVTLSTTDTNTLGTLRVQYVDNNTTTLPHWQDFMVVPAAMWNSLFATSGGNIPNAAADAAGGLPISDAGGLDLDTLLGRITGNVALASVLGALADAAADGDPTSADTVMQYVKQLVNTLVGTTGIPTFPASAAPANNVSLAEAIRQVYDEVAGLDGAAMRGTDNAALASELDKVPKSDAAVSWNATALAAIVDKILGRNLAGGADGTRTVQDALRSGRNRVVIDGTTITVYKEDDVTVAWTGVATRVAGLDPLQEVNPA